MILNIAAHGLEPHQRAHISVGSFHTGVVLVVMAVNQYVTPGYCHTPVAWPRRNWTSCAQRSPAAAPEPPREFTGVRPAHATDGLVK